MFSVTDPLLFSQSNSPEVKAEEMGFFKKVEA
jgi:hypothetical protein